MKICKKYARIFFFIQNLQIKQLIIINYLKHNKKKLGNFQHNIFFKLYLLLK